MFLLAVRGAGDDPGVVFEGSCAALLDRHPGMAADVARWEEELQLALEEAAAAEPAPVMVRMEHGRPTSEATVSGSGAASFAFGSEATPASFAFGSEATPAAFAFGSTANPAAFPGPAVVWFAGEAPPFAWLAWLAEATTARESRVPSSGSGGPVVWAFRDEAHMLSTQPEAGVDGAARHAWYARAAAWGAAQREDVCAADAAERIVAWGAFGNTLRLLDARIGEGFC